MKLENNTLVLKKGPDFKNRDLCNDEKWLVNGWLLADHSALCWKLWDSFFLVLTSLLAIIPSSSFLPPPFPTISVPLWHQRSLTFHPSLASWCFRFKASRLLVQGTKASGSSSWAQSTCYLLLEWWKISIKRLNLLRILITGSWKYMLYGFPEFRKASGLFLTNKAQQKRPQPRNKKNVQWSWESRASEMLQV